MGKSPGKWIKSFLFGRKSSRPHSSKRRDASEASTQKGLAVRKAPSALAADFPVISEPVFVRTSSCTVNYELEKRINELGSGELLIASANSVIENDLQKSGTSNDSDKPRVVLAAAKIQAVFRGYLARRAFSALKGIIRLQALIRGHLVRRQAVVTLHSFLGIIKFQALVRGKRVRSSGIGLEVSTKYPPGKIQVVEKLGSMEKLFANAFIFKLFSSSITRMPLRTRYIQCEPNSVFSWLARWTASHSWKPTPQSRKTIGSKPQAKRGSYAMETESGRSKRTIRRNNTSGVDSSSIITADPEKPKRVLRKFSCPIVDSMLENPQSELEKVKHNLRKVSNSMAENCCHLEIESDKSNSNLKKHSSTPSHVPDQIIEDSIEKTKDNVVLFTSETKVDLEIHSKFISGAVIDMPCDDFSDEVHPLQSISGDDIVAMNIGLSSKDDQIYNKNQKNVERRASFAAKSEYEENFVQTTPNLRPSYMATTESAKAKLRAQNSPSAGSDSVERNGIARRHSLPSINGKLSSQSPRTQRLVQASGKCGSRNDRSLLSSRDGNEKLLQVEWRR